MSVEAEYVQAVRDATAYWGSSPPGRRVEPGTIGTVDRGIFIPEDHLKFQPGIDPSALLTDDEPSLGQVDVWLSTRVRWVTVDASGAAPVGVIPVGAKVKLSFDAKRQVVIACTGGLTRHFKRLRAVKDEVRKLAREGKWRQPWGFVTDVFVVTSARIFFSSQRGGSATLDVQAPIPAELLSDKSVLASPRLAIGGGTESVGVKSHQIDSPCEPLFHALKFRREATIGPLAIGPKNLHLMGTDADFDEPPLGLSESEDEA
jgi:hypothetical protein